MLKNETINICDYYKSLDKKEKGTLLSYLSREYGMNYHTLQCKFTANRSEFTLLEKKVIIQTLNKNVWRQ